MLLAGCQEGHLDCKKPAPPAPTIPGIHFWKTQPNSRTADRLNKNEM